MGNKRLSENILPPPTAVIDTEKRRNSYNIDKLLIPVSNFVFLNIYTAPLIWLCLSILIIPFAPFFAFLLCFSIAILTIILFRIRSGKKAVIDWKNEIVVITGGSHGVGKELAHEISTRFKPRKVIVLDIQPTVHQNNLIAYYECDVSDKRKVKSVSEVIIRDYGHPTMLINNAGIVKGKSILELSEQDYEKTIGVNLLGQMFVTKAFITRMAEKNHGHIVNVASVLGLTGSRNMTDYCASKFGSIGFTESLRQDLHGTNVNVTCVYPGLINSGMFTGVTHRYPFFTPSLDVSQVCNAIANALSKNVSQDIKLPFYANLIPVLRLLPLEFSDWVREMSGANSDMVHYRYSASSKKN